MRATLFSAAKRPFNTATGGSVTDVSNYNGTGQTWRVHTFASTATFTVTRSVNPFRVLLVGGGGGGCNGGGGNGNSGGGASGQEVTSMTIAAGGYTATIGAGGAGGDVSNGSYGGTTFFNGFSAAGGLPGTSGNTPYGGWETYSTITGSSQLYGWNPAPRAYTTNGYGSGGGGGAIAGNWGFDGVPGVVIVAYRVA